MTRSWGTWLASASLAIGITIGASAAVSQAGLVLYLPFDETSGNTAADWSDTAQTAALKGDAAFAAGKFGNGLKVTSVGYAEVPHHANLNLGASLSMEAWINIESLADGYSSIMTKADTYMMHLDKEPSRAVGSVGVEPFAWPTVEWPPTLTAQIVEGEWTHVVGVFDGATRKVYLNGKEVSSGPHTGGTADSTVPVAVGYDSRGCCATRRMNATIDEARIWSRALTAAEVAELALGPLTTAVDPQGKAAAIWGSLKTR
ncbi:MAG: LamG domain-containing protein [Candidatus Poribacteria bacterium]|nr:LamG domain-containing protein [Candidatus Poribacteria bacterium]